MTDFLALLRRRAGLLILLVLGLGLGLAVGPRVWGGPQVGVETVVRRDLLQSVVASGRVEAPHRVNLGVQLTGTVRQVRVAEGQAVAAGDALIELEDAELRATLQQAELAVRQAQARLRQLREVQAPLAEQAVRQARANLDATRKALARSHELLAQGFIGQAALDEARRAEQVAQAQWRSAQEQRASARPTGSETAVAEASLAQAQAGAEAARARLAYATVRAPAPGLVIGRSVEPGDVVQPGKVLMLLSPEGATELVVQIDEKNLRLLRLGQRALVTADAYAPQRFEAELAQIHPGVDAQRGAVEVRLRVPQPPAYLKQDMTVTVDIEVARRAQALLVRADAVQGADTDAAWAWVLADGRLRRQPLKLGLRSNGWLEVSEGLQAGETVVVAGQGAALEEGRRVRAAPAPTDGAR